MKILWNYLIVCVLLFAGLLASCGEDQALRLSTDSSEQQSACQGTILGPGTGKDLEITVATCVPGGTYNYGNVNIYNGGSLTFEDANIDFWTSSILVEDNGSLVAGTPTNPIGTQEISNTVTIHLYGDDTLQPVTCKTDTNCGVSAKNWISNPTAKISLPNGVQDYFYKYKPLPAALSRC